MSEVEHRSVLAAGDTFSNLRHGDRLSYDLVIVGVYLSHISRSEHRLMRADNVTYLPIGDFLEEIPAATTSLILAQLNGLVTLIISLLQLFLYSWCQVDGLRLSAFLITSKLSHANRETKTQ